MYEIYQRCSSCGAVRVTDAVLAVQQVVSFRPDDQSGKKTTLPPSLVDWAKCYLHEYSTTNFTANKVLLPLQPLIMSNN